MNNSIFLGKKVAFATLGCKLNFSETAAISKKFIENGFDCVDYNQKADVYVINTCSVTETANKKCRQTIKKAIKQSPDAFIVVMGCYSQLKPNELTKIEGVDLILGNHEKFTIFNRLTTLKKKQNPDIFAYELNKDRTFFSSFSSNERTRAFLKIQDGCDYFCSYCTIPFARGRSRNGNIKDIISSVNQIVTEGIKEIILTGVNIGDFGVSSGETLFQLLEAIENQTKIKRVRLSSIEPNLLTNEIISFIASSKKILPHFHIPLQSGNNKILKLMNRKYKRELFAEKVKLIRKTIPNAGIGIDVIVGFPSETEEDFNDTYNFVNMLDVNYLHVFTFSERENTKAADFTEKVNVKEKDRRSRILHTLSEQKKKRFYENNINLNHLVLFESQNNNGKIYGFTPNYIKVETDYKPGLTANIEEVKILKLTSSRNAYVRI